MKDLTELLFWYLYEILLDKYAPTVIFVLVVKSGTGSSCHLSHSCMFSFPTCIRQKPSIFYFTKTFTFQLTVVLFSYFRWFNPDTTPQCEPQSHQAACCTLTPVEQGRPQAARQTTVTYKSSVTIGNRFFSLPLFSPTPPFSRLLCCCCGSNFRAHV